MIQRLVFHGCSIVFLIVGCNHTAEEPDLSAAKAPSTLVASERPTGPLPEKITNQFGMTFCLVEVDPERWDHQPSYPSRSYYFGESEVTWEQHEAFRRAAFGNGTFHNIDWSYNSGFPGDWRPAQNYAKALSAWDAQYDYRLPSQQEWSFACKNGYDQTCPGPGAASTIDSSDSKRPNKYGIQGLMNYDAECGDIPGLFLGMLDNGKGPACRCDQFTKGYPDGDDGLNELVVVRLVLVAEQ